MRIGITTAIATAIAIGVLVANGGNGGNPSLSNLFVDTNGGSCTRHATAVAYIDADACSSLDAARDAAQCNDQVEIRSGNYSAQQDLTGPANTCIGTPVVMTVLTGTANFDVINFGSPGTTLNNITIPADTAACSGSTCPSGVRQLDIDATCDGCSLTNSHIRTFNIFGADGVLVEDNFIDARGPNGNWSDSSIEWWDIPAYDGGSNITLRGNDIRDFFTGVAAPNDHGECLNIGGWTDGVLIENNTFDSCGNTSLIFFTFFGGSSLDPFNEDPLNTYPRNVCVRNNTFGDHLGSVVDIDFRTEIETVGQATSNIRIDPDQTFSTSSPAFNVNC